MSDARSERADQWRQERERQQVMVQLQQQQERAAAEAEAAAAAAEGNEGLADRRPSSLAAAPEERNLVIIIKADVQVKMLASFCHAQIRYGLHSNHVPARQMLP